MSVFVLLNMPRLHAQVGSDCMGTVRTIFKKMEALTMSPSVCRMSYSISSSSWMDGKLQTTRLSVERIASRDRIQTISDRLSVYQDASVLVKVVGPGRTIYINDSNRERLEQGQRQATIAARDTLLSNMRVVECEHLRGSASDLKIMMEPLPSSPRKYLPRRITYWVNSVDLTAQKMVIENAPGSQIATEEIDFGKVECDLGTVPEFRAPILSGFLDERGKLLPKYRGYTLVDERTQSRR
jgi:hypothetical protein